MNKAGKLLAVDFGKSKVGLAISDNDQVFVFRKGVIRDYKSLDGLFKRLEAIIMTEGVVRVIFGLPMTGKGENTGQTNKIREIGEKLAVFLKKDMVDYQDESFSSFEAGNELRRIGDKNERVDDDMAAVIILKNYLKEGHGFKKGNL